MSGRLAGLADVLVPDETGRRALEETLADWREERARAGTLAARALADARGVLAITRVFVSVSLKDLIRLDVWRTFGLTLLAAAVISMTMLAPYLTRLPTHRPLPAAVVAMIGAPLLPAGLAVILPLVLSAGLGFRRDRPAPVLATALVSTLFLVIMFGWVVPAANQTFRVRLWNAAGAPSDAEPPPYLAELSAPALLQKVVSDKTFERWTAVYAVSSRLAPIVAAPTLLVLGVAIRVRFGRRWRVAQGLCVIAVIGLSYLGSALASTVLRAFDWPTATIISRLAPELWVPLALAWLGTFALIRVKRSRNLTSEP